MHCSALGRLWNIQTLSMRFPPPDSYAIDSQGVFGIIKMAIVYMTSKAEPYIFSI